MYEHHPEAEFADVLIIGAGISGIGAAYRITERNPQFSYRILERRSCIGGTWDLFRYPGIRSDSDIFTLSFPWEPWRRQENVADGEYIREYLEATAHKHGIDEHMRFDTYVKSAEWDSTTDTWTVHAEQDGSTRTYRARFLFFGTGYYDYDRPYKPEIPGLERFAGDVVHPQFWPEDLDYAGKRVVVIGSGATAISLIPALAKKASHVTMLQRSPTYMMSMPRFDPMVDFIRKLLPPRLSHAVVRFRNAMFHVLTYFMFRKAPKFGRRFIRSRTMAALPEGYDVDLHFKPKYDPWDQRMCLILDHDLFNQISEGRAEVATGNIDHVDENGIVLTSGARVEADVIVTATGLQLQALGGIRIVVDGAEVRVRVPSISGVFAGTLSADGDTLAGRWTQLGQDLQVDPAQNLPAVEKALSGGRSPQWEVRELPGLNHLFQTATTGAMSEYGRSEETMAPAALEAVSAWITSTTGR